MSIINNVVIRSASYLKKREIYDVIMNAKNDNIPIFYQYNQLSNVQSKLPDQHIIGRTKNIKDVDGIVCCDIELYDTLTLSSNFCNIIDNYTLKTCKDNNSNHDYELVRFIVYDKEFKRKVDEEIVRTRNESEHN